ncbi:hypothetical protein R1sor_022790 [Riccia sorocarpa]|uniref:Uncharacterized protein n=1 Tax=Riccia sorocarpa TaxID=122646 RepID=A0ABD3GRU3_9MARC
MADSGYCDINGFDFEALVFGALRRELCSLPALAAALHALFGVILLAKIAIYGKKEDLTNRSPARILSSLHRILTWLTGILTLALLAGLIHPLWKWRAEHYQHFPLEEAAIVLLQAFGWFVTFVGLNREETHERALYERYFKVWHVATLLVSLPAGVWSTINGFTSPADFLIIFTPSLVFLSLVTAFFTENMYKQNYNWGKVPNEPSLKEPLLKEYVDEPLPDLSGYSKAGLFSTYRFAWLEGLFILGNKRPIERDDLPPLGADDDAAFNYTLFAANWENEKRQAPPGSPPSLWAAVIKTFWRPFLVPFCFGLLWTLGFLVGPLMVYLILQYLRQDADERVAWHGFLLVLIMFTGKFVELLKQHLLFHSVKLGLRMWGAVGSALYYKSLRLSNKARQDWSVGEITNLMSTDLQRFLNVIVATVQIILTPIQIAAGGILLFWVVGISMLTGFATLLVVVGLNFFLISKMREYRKLGLKSKDARMKTTVECLSNMKVIKLQSWDDLFRKKIVELRSTELFWLKGYMYTWACSIFVIWSVPVLVSVITFFTMYWLGVGLDAEKVFTALTTFSVIKEPVQQLPDNFSNILQMAVSMARMRFYLCSDEVDDNAVDRSEKSNSEYSVDIEAASFTWDSEADLLAVKDLTLRIPKGACYAVCGGVGSGKSSLLYCIMGELQKLTGSAKLCGKVAYVAQTAWIQTKSIRDNILFGRPMDAKRYAEAIQAAGLETDLKQMPFGDGTEIGERGINMSGGQKQRIQLARAVYADADVYLLDDPFSAVDAHTASHLFQECVRGALREKTVVLVTHQVEFLQATDCILVMKDGSIVQSGKYEELVREGREFGAFVSALEDSLQSVNQAKDDAVINAPGISDENDKGMTKAASLKRSNSSMGGRSLKKGGEEKDQFIQQEERRVGGVNASTFWMYVTAAYKGLFFFLIVLLNLGAYGLQVSGDSWLAGGVGPGRELSYVKTYAFFTFGGVVMVLLRSLLTAFAGIAIAQNLYEGMLRNIMRAPMLFFDTTPLGRVISRSSTDQTAVETELPNSVSLSVFSIIGLCGSVAVSSYVVPQLLFVVLPLAIVLLHVRVYFITSTREIIRVMSMCEAPVFLHVGETVAGITTIRAYQEQQWFAATNAERFEMYQRGYFHFQASIQWFSFRTQLICATMVSAVACLLILLPADTLGPGLAGLALNYSLGVNAVLGSLMYNFAIAEAKLISVERIKQYLDLPSEAPLVIEDRRPSPEWPNHGRIELDNLKFRYREAAPLVLKGVTCVIEARERVGVVGRTGSGKSTLVQALFRLVEPASGRILIDGLDISTVGLSDVRGRISVIPQEPAIFEGTLRINLDPFEKHTDVEIWEALEKCLLADAVRSKPEKLNASVLQGGDNWSVGERQLLCLGRALLTQARILVLDEATASVDITTDGIIQRTIIKEHFGKCTVLSIAHRIPSVIDSDRVLVLDAGYLKENASPETLLSNPNSLFSKLVYEYTDRTGMPHE